MIFYYLFYILLFNTFTSIRTVIVRDGDYMDGEFSKVTHSVKIEKIFKTFERMHLRNCVINCMIYEMCQSMNHDSASKQCELSDKNTTTSRLIPSDVTWSHLQEKQIEEEDTFCPKSVEPSQITKQINNTNETMHSTSDKTRNNPSSKHSSTTPGFSSSTLIYKDQSSSSVATSSSSTKQTSTKTSITTATLSPIATSSLSTKQTSISTSSMVATTLSSTLVTTNSTNKPVTIIPKRNRTLYGINFITQTTEVPLFPINVIQVEELSVCLWFYQFYQQTRNSDHGIFTAVDNPNNSECNLFILYLYNKRIWFYKDGGGDFTFTKHPDIVPSHFYHICFVWESNNITLHIRNSSDPQLSSETITNDAIPGVLEINEIALGQDMDHVEGYCVTNEADQCFQGTIGNIDVWSRVITMDEVDRHFGIVNAPFGEAVNRTTFTNYNETSSIKKNTHTFE